MNHLFKTIPLILLAALMALTFTGCDGCSSNNADLSESQSIGGTPNLEGEAQVTSHGPLSGAGADGGEDNSGDESSQAAPDEVYSVTGVIYDSGMGKFYVELEDGLVLAFHYQGADIDDLEDTRPGSPITVYFTGQLKGDDTSGVTVIRMETPEQ